MTTERWTPPGYFVSRNDAPLRCAHCGQPATLHLLWQDVAFCTSPPLELQRPARESAA